jgi:DNA-binding transcriptional ArsR family regulator
MIPQMVTVRRRRSDGRTGKRQMSQRGRATVNEQRRQILEMLAEGKITADEAEQLIDALESEQPESPPGAVSRSKARPKHLRVVVSWADGPGGDGPGRVNVRVPLQLLRAGVRLTSLIPPQALTKVNAELDRSGVPIDLSELKPQHLEELIEQLDEVTIDVDDPDTKVQVFCE